MTRGRLCFALALISGFHADGQSIAASWFPVKTGTRWVYQHETRDDTGEGRGRLDIHRWQTEEIVRGSWIVPEGTLAGVDVRVIEGSPPPGWRLDPNRAYLIRDACVYGPDYGEASWDPASHQPASLFLESLHAGQLSPDFCFPLYTHKTWAAPHGLPDWNVNRPEEAKDWRVVGSIAHDPSAPDNQMTFHIRSASGYPGSGMTVDIWFERGVGMVREEAIHHGTIGEVHTRLIRFDPPKHE